MRRLTECFSMYSDMSMRTMAVSSSNRNDASALVSSVLPTPVGPRNMKEPIGRFGSCSPARARRTAVATDFTASACPTTRRPSTPSMARSLSRSPCSILSTGTPVQRDTTWATLSAVTASDTSTSEPLASTSPSLFSRSGTTP